MTNALELSPDILLTTYTDAVVDAAEGTGSEQTCIPLEAEIRRRLRREAAMSFEAKVKIAVVTGDKLFDAGARSAAEAIVEAARAVEAR